LDLLALQPLELEDGGASREIDILTSNDLMKTRLINEEFLCAFERANQTVKFVKALRSNDTALKCSVPLSFSPGDGEIRVSVSVNQVNLLEAGSISI
jgi:hypothetical protein